MVSKPRCWTIRALCRGGRCRGTVLIGGTGAPGSCTPSPAVARPGPRDRAGIDAKEEAEIAGIIPAVEMLGLGEVGVPPHQKRAEAGLAAEEDGPVDEAGGQFM